MADYTFRALAWRQKVETSRVLACWPMVEIFGWEQESESWDVFYVEGLRDL